MKNKKTSVKNFFIDLFKSHRRELIIISLIATIGSIMSSAIPYVYGKLFDLAVIPNTQISLLLSLIGLWALLGLISNFTQSKTTFLGKSLGARVSFESEVKSYGHFLRLPISFHKSKNTGEVLQKISRGSWELEEFINISLSLVPSILFLLFALILMSIVRWELALILVLVFVIYSIITIKLTRPLMRSYEKTRKIFEKEYGKIYDKLYNIFLISFSL